MLKLLSLCNLEKLKYLTLKKLLQNNINKYL